MKRATNLVAGVVLLSWAAAAQAQGLLVVIDPHQQVALPRPIVAPQPAPPPTGYKIKELAVQARLVDQVARVQVSQSFVNTGSLPLEASFIFPLPYDGAIDRLTLMVDGKEFPAKLLPAKDARAIFESIVRKNRDPALLEWIGTGMFQTSVFPVPPGAERKVTLTYSQVLRKSQGLTDFLFPLSTARYTSHPLEKLDVRLTIESQLEIKNVYSPSHPIEVTRTDGRHATVSYTRTNDVPVGDFRLFYDVDRGQLGASVVSYRPDAGDEGYFLLLASPQVKAADAERPKKTVVFVVDRSGSMSEEKIDQARKAVRFVLENLREGDLFNIVAFDSAIEAFRPELQTYNDENRKAALGFIESIYAGGATNIDGALATAFSQLQDPSRPNYLIFMTDGQPTVGETNESKLVAAAMAHNRVRARLVTFGVGYDVNSRLLDRLSRENFGQSEYVRPDENIEVHVSRLYARMTSPVLTDVAVKFEFDQLRTEEGDPVSRLFPRQPGDLFEGDQMVLVGRYKKTGRAKVVITGSVGGRAQSFDFPAELVEKSGDESYAFVEKLWAMRRIGEIIDQLDLVGMNDELVKELVDLSTKHGILTPYTSFLADENARPADLALGASTERAKHVLGRLHETEGQAAFSQRAEKGGLQKANIAPEQSVVDAPGKGANFRDIDNDALVYTRGLRNVGNQALYCRGKTWVTRGTSKLDPEKDADKIKPVERFSDDYFKLVAANTPAQNQILCSQREGEELLIELRGQAYLVK